MPDEPTTPDQSGDPTPDPTPDPAADLGDAGKAALAAERKARATAEKATKALEKQLAELQTASLSDQEKAVREAEDRGRTEALSTANARILRAEVKALAGGKIEDPEDAVRLLDLTEFDVAEDGSVDTNAIASAIDALVKQKPYLSPKGQRPAPLPGGGAMPSEETIDMSDWMRARAAR